MSQSTLEAFAGPDLSQLTPRQREMWTAVELEDRGIREVARERELNPGTVYRHVDRARAKLGRDAP